MPYLDHAATTPLRPEALDAMLPWLRDAHGNASSVHGPGRRARVAVEQARRDVAEAMGCEPAEVVFTSGGTEADNAALLGVLGAPEMRAAGRTALVTSAAEHDAVLRAADRLEAAGHAVARLAPGAAGAPTPEAVADALTPATGLVSVMAVNNETGALADVRGIAEAAHAGGAWVHTDAVQAAGLLDVRLGTLGADLLTVSAHKVGGPTGVGALAIRQGVPFAPLIAGGAQERRRRGGTENVAGVVGFAAALRLAHAEREATAARLGALRDRLRARLVASFGDRVVVNTPEAAAPHILNVSFRPGAGGPLDGEMLLLGLDLEGVHVSAGSACTSGALEPSHVLLAMGVPRDTAAATVRVSLGRTTEAADTDAAAEALGRVVARLSGGA